MKIRGPAAIVNTTLSGNDARYGGAIDVQFNPLSRASDPRFGAVRNAISLQHTTMADNTAEFGSGIFINSGRIMVQAVATIFANQPKEQNCYFGYYAVRPGWLDSVDSNLDSGLSCNLSGVNDLIDTDPILRPLADNGGFTRTHAAWQPGD